MSDAMRILMIVPQAFYTTRGTPLSAYHRTKELIARGHEVDILTYAVGGKPPDLAARIFRSHGPHFRKSIEAGPSRVKFWFDFLLFWSLLSRLLAKRYDLMYAHEEGAFLARLAGALLRVPYIYDMHSSLPLQITDWKFSASRRVISFFGWVERVSIRGARAVVAISPAVARVARAADPDVPIVTIINHFEIDGSAGAAAAAAIRARYGIGEDRRIVLYTGSFVALQARGLLKALIDPIAVAAVIAEAQLFLARYGSKAARDEAYDQLFAVLVAPPVNPVAPASVRILTTSYEYPPLGGGGAKVANGIARRLVARGYAVDLITMGFRGLPRDVQVAGVQVHRVPGIRMRVASCSSMEMIPYVLLAPLRIVHQCRARRYAVNHAHFIFPDGIVAYMVKRFTGVPYVITAHGSDVPNYNPDRFKMLHRLLLPVWRNITNDASLIICPSASIEGLIKAKNPNARTRIIPNAIATDKFPPGSKQPRRVLVVTRFFERKGVQFVIRALAHLQGRFDVDIVGNGPYLDTVTQLAQELGVSVKFWGHLDNDSAQLRELYQAAAIFVFTSEAENFPIVLLEAMTAGAAIITTSGTGCEEVVGNTALLVPVRDAEAIAQALSRLSDSPQLVAQLGQAARARAIAQFGWDGVIDKHLDVYRQFGSDANIQPQTRDVESPAASAL